jgi:hypothetical protein
MFGFHTKSGWKLFAQEYYEAKWPPPAGKQPAGTKPREIDMVPADAVQVCPTCVQTAC